MYKVKNHYRDAQILDLNLMEAQNYRHSKLSIPEMALPIGIFMLIVIVTAGLFMPDMTFLAECQNIPGGDVCFISLR